MPKPPARPFFRTGTQSWYFKLRGKFISLGKDRDHAYAKYYALMANREPTTPGTPVEVLLGRFLSWCELHREPLTYDWYRDRLKSFRDHVGSDLTVSTLKPYHVTDWLDSRYRGRSGSYRNGAVRAVTRAFNWAVKQGHIAVNPVRGVEKPRAHGRVVYLAPRQWKAVLAQVKESDSFKDFLRILRATGCRPQEARQVEVRHFDEVNEQWTFPVSESKGRQEPRIVPLNAEALAITKRLVRKFREGRLFRNAKGQPLTKSAITNRFRCLSEDVGFKVFAYAIRHTFITDALLRGANPVTLAYIVGHRDATMILKIYQHLNLNKGHVRQELALATGETLAKTAIPRQRKARHERSH